MTRLSNKDSKPGTPILENYISSENFGESKIDVSSDMKAITKIIEKEQKIYNLVMHELIRQVTIECVERGELLSKLRDRYANLIGSIPAFMKNIYNKCLALQAMEKRLAYKLVEFKDRVENLGPGWGFFIDFFLRSANFYFAFFRIFTFFWVD